MFKKLVQSSGLILVTGPLGGSKSTTMATMINEINKTRYGHILTLEDPVEFTHEDNRCMITHKEIGQDIPTFNEGRAAFRECRCGVSRKRNP